MVPRHGLGSRRLWLAALIILSGMGNAACEKHSKEEGTPAREVQLDLPQLAHDAPRVKVVAEADRLAALASQQTGSAGADLLEKAAGLRESAFVAFGKKVDALEAIELYSDAASYERSRNCDLGLKIAALKGQLSGDLETQYRDTYLLKEGAQGDCALRASRALAVLSSARPDEESLRKLRRDLESQTHPAHGVEHLDRQKDSVVVPETLRKSLDEPTKITRIEPYFAERTARVIVHVTHPTRFQVGSLAASENKGPRLFVDIDHASFDEPEIPEARGLVEQIRLGARKDSSRIVLDLAQPVFHRVFYLPEPFRLMIDLSLDSPEESANPRHIRRVVLDPGHGGHDPGAVGPNGLQEKDVALDIAHRAAPLLAREVGVSTLLTRDVDAYVPLDERSARANAFHADLFISIHLNASPDRDARGVMTFVLDTSKDAAASKIAARENDSTEAAAAELANSLSRIENAERRAASQTFAQLLQRAAGASLRQGYADIADHGVRSAGFYVLAGAAMPSVLFEGSFISNPLEAHRLNHQDYRQRLADSIVNAVRAYREGL